MAILKVNKLTIVDTPTQGTKGSAGIDLYMPKDVIVPANARGVFIHLGVAIEVPKVTMWSYYHGLALEFEHQFEWQTRLGLLIQIIVVRFVLSAIIYQIPILHSRKAKDTFS